jgi:hypothetical protein
MTLLEAISHLRRGTSGIADIPLDEKRLLRVENMLQAKYKHAALLPIQWNQLLADPVPISISRTEAEGGLAHHPIQSNYDIDSAIVTMNTLAAIRGDIRLYFVPSYKAQITQSLKFAVRGRRHIEKLKHIHLCSPTDCSGKGYQTYIFFPNLPVRRTQETFLSDIEQEAWIDDIVLPTLEEVLPPSVLARCPQSFADAVAKASARGETVTSGPFSHDGNEEPWGPTPIHHTGSGRIPLHEAIPAAKLAEIWRGIQVRIHQFRGREQRINGIDVTSIASDAFRDPLLITQAHGMLALFGQSSAEEAASRYFEHFQHCFDDDHIDQESTCFDIGVNHEPHVYTDARGRRRGVTLIFRRGCLDRWASYFRLTDGEASDQPPSSREDQARAGRRTLLREEDYHFCLTRDAGSRNVVPTATNPFRSLGGLAQAKAYNVVKEQFSTPIKHNPPFGDPRLGALAFKQDLIDRIYKFNTPSGSTLQKAQVKRMYRQTKHRWSEALVGGKARERNFGVRQEFRVSLATLREISEYSDPRTSESPSSSSSYSESQHRRQERGPTQLGRGGSGSGSNPSSHTERSDDAQHRRCERGPTQLGHGGSGSGSNPSSHTEHSEHAQPQLGLGSQRGVASAGEDEHRDNPPHRPFFTLFTDSVNAFQEAVIERFLWVIEAASLLADADDTTSDSTVDAQLSRCRVVEACLDALQATAFGDVWRRPRLWSRVLKPRLERCEGESDADLQARRDSQAKIGLGFESSVEDFGIPFFTPSDLNVDAGFPYFSDSVFQRIAYTDTSLERRLGRGPKHGSSTVVKAISREERLVAAFAEKVRAADSRSPLKYAVHTAAELVCQAYVLDVFDVLASRFKSAIGLRNAEEGRDEIRSRLAGVYWRAEEGLCGLDVDIISTIIPRASFTRVKPAGNVRGALAKFSTSASWRQRLEPLFSLDYTDDELAKLGWSQKPFRRLLTSLHAAFIRAAPPSIAAGPELEEIWSSHIMRWISSKLWAIPLYDAQKLSCVVKSNKSVGGRRQEELLEMDVLERTQFITADCSPRVIRELEGRFLEADTRDSRQAFGVWLSAVTCSKSFQVASEAQRDAKGRSLTQNQPPRLLDFEFERLTQAGRIQDQVDREIDAINHAHERPSTPV